MGIEECVLRGARPALRADPSASSGADFNSVSPYSSNSSQKGMNPRENESKSISVSSAVERPKRSIVLRRQASAIGVLIAASIAGYIGVVHDLQAHPSWAESQVSIQSVDLSPGEAHALIQIHRDNPDFVILDVRTPAEFAEGHLAHAILVDFHGASFRQDIAQLDRQNIYLVYCQRGVRSDRTIRMMQEMGFQQVYNLPGGLARWQQEDFDTSIPQG